MCIFTIVEYICVELEAIQLDRLSAGSVQDCQNRKQIFLLSSDKPAQLYDQVIIKFTSNPILTPTLEAVLYKVYVRMT